jgi:hypothetical protein
MTSKVREYILQQNRLRQLEKQGRGETEDAFYLQDLLEDLWREFSAEEAKLVTGPKSLTEG